MKSLKICTFVFVFFFLQTTVFAQNEERLTSQEIPQRTGPEIPYGMEEIQIGGSAKLIVPKGAKTRKVGAQIIVEGTKEYMSRRFLETDERLEKIEKQQLELQEQIKALEEAGIKEHAELKTQLGELQESVKDVQDNSKSKKTRKKPVTSENLSTNSIPPK